MNASTARAELRGRICAKLPLGAIDAACGRYLENPNEFVARLLGRAADIGSFNAPSLAETLEEPIGYAIRLSEERWTC